MDGLPELVERAPVTGHRRTQARPTVVRYFRSQSEGFERNMTVHMFAEDVHLAVMPIGGRSRRHPAYTAALEGDDPECERARKLIGTIQRYERSSDDELICDAVGELAQQLAWEGSAPFEIVHDENEGILLYRFTSKRLVRLPYFFVQIIPKKDWGTEGKKLVTIPASRVWYVDMPKELGGASHYRRILAQLARFDALGPKFWREDLASGRSPGNIQEYVRRTRIYFGRVTRVWGWDQRDLSRGTEFFGCYNHITRRWAQAIMREHIIAELNRLLARLQIACEIKVAGLPTPQEILDTRNDMEAGRISFSTALERVSI